LSSTPSVQPRDRAAPQAGRPAPPNEPIIRLVDVHKSFGNQKVLKGINLDIAAGQTTVIMGPSGCGKSVMLKHIVGLLKPNSGEIWFDSIRIDKLGERDLRHARLQIGLLFQMGALFDSMTVEENVAFPLAEHTRMDAAARRQRVVECLATVDMEGYEPRLPSELSGGQRKRVALARAIVLQPRVVLYDEPTTGLDPIRADGINQLIIKLKKKMGVTGVVVTHDLVSARKVADRVAMLHDGVVLAEGTYRELEANQDPRVQHFLGGQYDPADDAAHPNRRGDNGDPESD
jgi:phospholipid/cholesterol/gamma-HCH transport system ATP-binding protein